MDPKNIIDVFIFNVPIGRVGYDINSRKSYFQYNPDFLDSGELTNIFPYILKRIKQVQVFDKYDGGTFRGLPPMIADSLPDQFGNIIFKEWLGRNSDQKSITVIEQLAYTGHRGMGAIEYRPAIDIPETHKVDIDAIIKLLSQVLDLKETTKGCALDELSLLNVFKIGTSPGGARAKIIISENIKDGTIIPGDLEYSADYNHYLVKLDLGDCSYSQEKVELVYHLLASESGIKMMPSKLIDDKHFATLRYDRQNGKKYHVLTASGLTGWDFKKADNSTYENLFKLAIDLKISYQELEELYRRMIFNVVFSNYDDHLKNHSFVYNHQTDSWNLSPAYDITYPFNIDQKFTRVSRAMSINGKRENIHLDDVISIADKFSIKNSKAIINRITSLVPRWTILAKEIGLPGRVVDRIHIEFNQL